VQDEKEIRDDILLQLLEEPSLSTNVPQPLADHCKAYLHGHDIVEIMSEPFGNELFDFTRILEFEK